MPQLNFNHGDSQTYSNGNNSSDSHHFRRAIKLRMNVFAFLQALFALVKKKSDVEPESHNRVHPAVSRSLQLKFSQEMPGVVFTGECIVSKGDGTLEVALVDGDTGDRVRYGPGTSGKMEIVPVDGSFDTSTGNWTSEYFNSKIVVGEDGGKSLFGGKSAYVKMKEGNAHVCGIKFKHKRKWMRKRKFRLGARFVDQLNAIKIREAVSEPFIIKDMRGKTKKRYPPSPTDEVWRLNNISKKGAFHKCLFEKKIQTVEDFLIEFLKDPGRLRDILGNMSNGKWKATLDHALTCHLNARIYLYTPQESEQKFNVVFNANKEVIGLYSGHDFTSIENLSGHQQDYAHTLMETAFANWEKVLKFDDGASCSSCPCLSSPTNDLAAPSTAFGNSELQDDKNNDALSNQTSQPDDLSRDLQRQLRILGSSNQQSHVSELSQAIASLGALSESDTDGWSRHWDMICKILSSDEILETSVDQQVAPSNLEAPHSVEFCSEMVNGYMQANGIHSFSLTDAGPSSPTWHQIQHNEDVNSFQNIFSDLGNLIHGTEHLQSVIDIDQPSAGVRNNSLGIAAIPKYSKGWVKMSSLVRWFLLKKKQQVAKKSRFY